MLNVMMKLLSKQPSPSTPPPMYRISGLPVSSVAVPVVLQLLLRLFAVIGMEGTGPEMEVMTSSICVFRRDVHMGLDIYDQNVFAITHYTSSTQSGKQPILIATAASVLLTS